MSFPRPAFTLIELLVVVAIIAVLLAMLMPALEKAIYQAELVSCGSRLAVIGGGVTQYALDHGRKYPYNPAHDLASAETWSTNTLRSDQTTHPRQQSPIRGDIDMRLVIRDYIQINRTLNDPLAAPVELEKSTAELTYSNYSLWYGWRWVTPANGPGAPMRRMGDRFTWNGIAGGQRTEFTFDILASDMDLRLNAPQYRSGHPDHDDKMTNWIRQNVKDPVDPQDYTRTLSVWTTNSGRPRGSLDTNFAFQDLAVVRYNHVEMYDDRMIRLPHANNGKITEEVVQIPTN